MLIGIQEKGYVTIKLFKIVQYELADLTSLECAKIPNASIEKKNKNNLDETI